MTSAPHDAATRPTFSSLRAYLRRVPAPHRYALLALAVPALAPAALTTYLAARTTPLSPLLTFVAGSPLIVTAVCILFPLAILLVSERPQQRGPLAYVRQVVTSYRSFEVPAADASPPQSTPTEGTSR